VDPPTEDSGLKRFLPIFIALGLAVVAFTAAFAVNAGIRTLLRLPDDAVLATVDAPQAVADAAPEDRGDAAPARAGGMSRSQYVEGILGRNIFDHTKIGVIDDRPGSGTDLNVRLLGTIVAEPAEFSSALIAWEGESKTAGYGIGDKLAEDAEIIAIEPKRVTVRRGDGNVEYITMDDKGGERPAPAAGEKPAEGGEEGVSSAGEGKYEVDRGLIDKYTQDIEALSKMARAIPHRGPDGETDGYRLSGIRRNSLASQLGIKNGDVIHSVNGRPLTSMQEAMSAYQELQTGSSFTFEITRRGQKQTLEYQVK
jgi:type II secretion system protein C